LPAFDHGCRQPLPLLPGQIRCRWHGQGRTVTESTSLRRIVCALDLEAPARTALCYAGVIAERFHSSIDALHAPAPLRGRDAGSAAPDVNKLMAAHNSRERLREIVDATPGRVRPTPYVIEGLPASVILAHAEQQRADLVVLGADRSSRLTAYLGSGLTNQVAARASCAVLTVRDSPSRFALRNILVPVDFSACTPSVLDWAGDFAKRFGADIHVLHVVARSAGLGSIDRLWGRVDSTPHASAQAELRDIEARFRYSGVRSTHGVRDSNGVASAIAELADSGQFDLVIVGLHGGPRRPDRLAPGVVASVRDQATAPVLSVRAPAIEMLFAGSGFAHGHEDAYGPHPSS
jgi:nucleotide-binding universal stress UspA family protein